MSPTMSDWAVAVAAYLIGSLDFALVVAQAHGVDIRSTGSKNPGTSNVLRTLGKGPAAMVLLGDLLKGVIAAAIGSLAAVRFGTHEPLTFGLFTGGLAVVGHCFPVWHRFKGGKGVATGAGVLLFVVPLAALILATIWVVLAKAFKVASVASLVAAVGAIPLAMWSGVEGWGLVWLGAMVALVVARHLPNIKRLVRGVEEKVPT